MYIKVPILMADPLSIASGIAGILSLAGVILCRSYEYGIAVKDAPADFLRLLDEITSLSGVLFRLQALVNVEGSSSNVNIKGGDTETGPDHDLSLRYSGIKTHYQMTLAGKAGGDINIKSAPPPLLSPCEQVSGLNHPLSECQVLLEEISKALENAMPTSGTSNRSVSEGGEEKQKLGSKFSLKIIKRLCWPMKHHEILEYLNRLERLKATLSLALLKDVAYVNPPLIPIEIETCYSIHTKLTICNKFQNNLQRNTE